MGDFFFSTIPRSASTTDDEDKRERTGNCDDDSSRGSQQSHESNSELQTRRRTRCVRFGFSKPNLDPHGNVISIQSNGGWVGRFVGIANKQLFGREMGFTYLYTERKLTRPLTLPHIPSLRRRRRRRCLLCCPSTAEVVFAASNAVPILCLRSMCRSRAAIEASKPQSRRRSRASATTSSSSAPPSSSYGAASSNGTPTDPGSRPLRRPPTSGTSSSSNTFTSSSSSALSLASVRSSLPEAPAFYPFSELCAATNNFLAKRLPGASSSAWRCTLRGRDVVVIQKSLRRHREDLAVRLASLGRSHHSSLARLLGASSADDYVYLVYEYVPGASLADCLRNSRNPSFTPLASWISRVQVAADVAQGLEYIHHHSSAAAGVHNRITSSAIIVTEPNIRAKICHFGAADLAGEVSDLLAEKVSEITPIPSPSSTRKGPGERQGHIEGTRGYIAPEVISGAPISRRSDVFAFGVVLLELLSGDEPLKYRYHNQRKEFGVVSLIDTAKEAMGTDDKEEEEDRRGRVRRWVDPRLRDSFPVEAAEKLIRVALRCVEAEPAARPEMTWVAGKVSKAYIESSAWADKLKVPTDFSVSMAPR